MAKNQANSLNSKNLSLVKKSWVTKPNLLLPDSTVLLGVRLRKIKANTLLKSISLQCGLK